MPLVNMQSASLRPLAGVWQHKHDCSVRYASLSGWSHLSLLQVCLNMSFLVLSFIPSVSSREVAVALAGSVLDIPHALHALDTLMVLMIPQGIRSFSGLRHTGTLHSIQLVQCGRSIFCKKEIDDSRRAFMCAALHVGMHGVQHNSMGEAPCKYLFLDLKEVSSGAAWLPDSIGASIDDAADFSNGAGCFRDAATPLLSAADCLWDIGPHIQAALAHP
eukprot:UN3564